MVRHFEPTTVPTPDGLLRVTVKPSGVIGWNYADAGEAGAIGIVVVLVAVIADVVGRAAFRFGSTVWVHGPDGKAKGHQRHPSRAAADESAAALVTELPAHGLSALARR